MSCQQCGGLEREDSPCICSTCRDVKYYEIRPYNNVFCCCRSPFNPTVDTEGKKYSFIASKGHIGCSLYRQDWIKKLRYGERTNSLAEYCKER